MPKGEGSACALGKVLASSRGSSCRLGGNQKTRKGVAHEGRQGAESGGDLLRVEVGGAFAIERVQGGIVQGGELLDRDPKRVHLSYSGNDTEMKIEGKGGWRTTSTLSMVAPGFNACLQRGGGGHQGFIFKRGGRLFRRKEKAARGDFFYIKGGLSTQRKGRSRRKRNWEKATRDSCLCCTERVLLAGRKESPS